MTVVTWKWTPLTPYRSTFTAGHVNTLARMVARHYPHPHEMVCVTDDPLGIDPSIRIVPLWPDCGRMVSPHGSRHPSCYRRLKAFSAEMADTLGSRFVSIDLDTVIMGDLSPLWNRPEPFVIWGDTDPRALYNGSMWLMDAGARRQVWETFDPVSSPRAAMAAGRLGSDQGWISYCLGVGEARWTTADGVYSYRKHIAPRGDMLPADARVVNFHGSTDPWSSRIAHLPWIQEHYR